MIIPDKDQPLPALPTAADEKRTLAENEQLPPPYAPPTRAFEGGSSTLSDPAQAPARTYSIADVAASNFICVHTRHSPIYGTYKINPELPEHTIPNQPRLSPKELRRRAKSREAPLNASFECRHGNIDLKLSTDGTSANKCLSYVEVSARHGDVNVDVHAIRPGKNINLVCYSRKGTIVLFVPRNFFGAIQLYTKKGRIHFLPTLSTMMRVAKQYDREALILLGDGDNVPTTPPNPAAGHFADFVNMTSRRGDLVVGISGEDIWEKDPGFWKRYVVPILKTAEEKWREREALKRERGSLGALVRTVR
ncbi:hypothetical protein JAAARDRAFT_30825 [Jaapia argillacea MUCL 33604]|uniref:DUF7330 domain-containing protein n=1 Tax=Jaapia argillacea MUCL 33604 TaxID=933084 RepID=A0A067QFL6_9AGAM|nr:hypothetical protein JAAARDRAFT_30825 [Jaapia argillacea MUCL 33604]